MKKYMEFIEVYIYACAIYCTHIERKAVIEKVVYEVVNVDQDSCEKRCYAAPYRFEV